MTSPTDLPIEDRLRAHFEDEARRMPIPGPETDTMLAQARDGLAAERERRGDGANRRPGLRRSFARPGSHRTRRLLAVAAAVVAVVGAVTVALARHESGSDVSTDPSPAPTTVSPPPTTAAPTTTAPQVAPPPATSVVVGLEGVAGGWTGSAWQAFADGDSLPGVGDLFTIVRLGEPLRAVVGQASEPLCAGSEDADLDLGLAGSLDEGQPPPIAVSGIADPRPRPVEVLDPAQPALGDAAVDVAARLGVPDASPTVTQALRADLDGDGTTETVVAAEHALDSTGAQPAVTGDLAVVFVLQRAGAAVDTAVVSSYVADSAEPTAFHRFVIAALADLNGDGSMEIAAYTDYPEGSALAVHEAAPAGDWREVLTAGCGV
jgi:hypothetical protein